MEGRTARGDTESRDCGFPCRRDDTTACHPWCAIGGEEGRNASGKKGKEEEAGAALTCGTGSAVREKGNKGTDEWGRLVARGRSDACGRLLRASDGVGPRAQ